VREAKAQFNSGRYLTRFCASLEILRSWINLIDENGWVGREQILGEEARSKVSYADITLLPL
jgi:hypothetical protein